MIGPHRFFAMFLAFTAIKVFAAEHPAAELVSSLYAMHAPWSHASVDWRDPKQAKTYLTKRLQRLFEIEVACGKRLHEVTNLDFDPILEAQDYTDGIGALEVQVVSQDPSSAVVSASFLWRPGDPTTHKRIDFVVVHVQSEWRIDDVRYPAASLVLMLSRQIEGCKDLHER